MTKKRSKSELLAWLNKPESTADMEVDELLDWYLELIYDYCETIGDDSLKELIQQYWNPEDICDYLESKLRNPLFDAVDSLQEVAEFLRYKNFETRWSYFETDEEINFVDVTKEELERLRQRILDFLAKEDKE